MKTRPFDPAAYLVTAEAQTEFIAAALETGDAAYVLDAIGVVARARGMAEIAAAADLNPKSLYRALGETGNPEFATVLKVLDALGLQLTATAKTPPTKPARKATRKMPARRKAA